MIGDEMGRCLLRRIESEVWFGAKRQAAGNRGHRRWFQSRRGLERNHRCPPFNIRFARKA
jgi:hypothetical protein